MRQAGEGVREEFANHSLFMWFSYKSYTTEQAQTHILSPSQVQLKT